MIGKTLLALFSASGLFLSCFLVFLWLWLPGTGLQTFSGRPPLFSFDARAATGFAISPDGLIVTNRHVVPGCGRITVSGAGMRAVRARLVLRSSDPDIDLAVIKIDAPTPDFVGFAPGNWLKDAAGQNLSRADIAREILAADNRYPGTLTMVGYPDTSLSPLPTSSPAHLLPSASIARTRFYPEIEAITHPGNSGSPVLDGSGAVVGVAFRASESPTEFKRHKNVPFWDMTFEQAVIIPSDFVTQFVHGLAGIPKAPPTAGDPLRAVYRVFCFRTIFTF